MGTLNKDDVTRIFRNLDKIQKLCDYMRNKHFDAPFETVYDAVGAEMNIRAMLMEAIVSDIEVEAPDTVPAEAL